MTGRTASCAPSTTVHGARDGRSGGDRDQPGRPERLRRDQAANNAIVEFSRDPETGPAERDRLHQRGSRGGVRNAARESQGARATPTASPSARTARNVYVASYDDEAVAEFSRDSDDRHAAHSWRAPTNHQPARGQRLRDRKALGLENAHRAGRRARTARMSTWRPAQRKAKGAIVAFEREPGNGSAHPAWKARMGASAPRTRRATNGTAIDGPEDLRRQPGCPQRVRELGRNNAVLELPSRTIRVAHPARQLRMGAS